MSIVSAELARRALTMARIAAGTRENNDDAGKRPLLAGAGRLFARVWRPRRALLHRRARGQPGLDLDDQARHRFPMAYQTAKSTIPAIRIIAKMMKNESKILSCFGWAATFEAVVMHELGHVLGLNPSVDPASVMCATLGAGTANRDRTTADLNVPESDGGGPAGLHARGPRPAPPRPLLRPRPRRA
jgi:hypothetical protein